MVDEKLSHHYGAEMVARFRDRPDDNVEANTLRIHLVRAIAEDPEVGRQLASTFGEKTAKPGRKWRTAAASVVAVLGGGYLIGRVSAPEETPRSAPTTVTSTAEHTVSEEETRTPHPMLAGVMAAGGRSNKLPELAWGDPVVYP